MREELCSRHVVLLGIGHTNAHIVRMWGMQPIPDTALTCLSDSLVATYSGMLPATLARQIPRERMEIDLVRLCASVGARLITDRVTDLDLLHQQVRFATRPALPFDILSIGIGSVPNTDEVVIHGESLIKIKPMQTFLDRLRAAVESRAKAEPDSLRVLVVGSGVAGIEITFCLAPFLQTLGIRHCKMQIVTHSDRVLPEMGASVRRRVMPELQRRGVKVTLGKAVRNVDEGSVKLDDGSRLDADIVIWATGASPPGLLGMLGLPTDDRGFLSTDRTLRSVSGKPIFAVGDSGTIAGEKLPKAGVYAVRQGPVLWQNMGRLLRGQTLKEYRPQHSFLKLINRGDGSAIGHWHGLAFSGRWVMRWKNRIDTNFMEKFRPLDMNSGGEPMQCLGCGSKLGARPLQSALQSGIHTKSGGEMSPLPIEDAVEVGNNAHTRFVASTDFFSSPERDAFLSGRMAALHAASDVIATGARPTKALANVVLQAGDRDAQQQWLSDFLAGAQQEFQAMGASIAGGHTIVGPRSEVGFTVIGESCGERLLAKSGLKIGDQLFLTKPLGVGVLLAAHMRNRCHARDYRQLLDTMLLPQHAFAPAAVQVGMVAATDITGFGLAGHLLEMLFASGVGATIDLDTIPVLPGAIAAVESGIESSLIAENFLADESVRASVNLRGTAKYRLLFDPQTCGGFLFACSPPQLEKYLQLTSQSGMPAPQRIGYVEKRKRCQVPLSLIDDNGT